jgi:hypothetical protein
MADRDRYKVTIVVYETGNEDRVYEATSHDNARGTLTRQLSGALLEIEVDEVWGSFGRRHGPTQPSPSHFVRGIKELHGEASSLDAFRASGNPGERRWAARDIAVIPA